MGLNLDRAWRNYFTLAPWYFFIVDLFRTRKRSMERPQEVKLRLVRIFVSKSLLASEIDVFSGTRDRMIGRRLREWYARSRGIKSFTREFYSLTPFGRSKRTFDFRYVREACAYRAYKLCCVRLWKSWEFEQRTEYCNWLCKPARYTRR